MTANAGGATWSELVDYLKAKFRYNSPLQEPLDVIGDICRINGHKEVCAAITDRLKGAKLIPPRVEVAKLPWFIAFTTNYDTALEEALRIHQAANVRSIVTGNEFAIAGLPSELLCVKLMGSLDIPYGQAGAMVVDKGDLEIARETRGRIFDILASCAANLTFLFVGHSLDDGVFLSALDRLTKSLGTSPATFFAVLRSEPSAEEKYRLAQYGVTVFVEGLDGFCERLSREVSLRNPIDGTKLRVPLGDDVVAIDSTKCPGLLAVYNPLLFENLEQAVTPKQFLHGYTESLYPFAQGWHFERPQVEAIVRAILTRLQSDEAPPIVVLTGNPGSGRTFCGLAAINKLVRKERTLAIKLPSYGGARFPSVEELQEYVDEVRRAAVEKGVEGPRQVVFWAENPLEPFAISQFRALAANSPEHVSLVMEEISLSSLLDGVQESKGKVTIDVDVELDASEKQRLSDYIVNTVRHHRFPEISAADVKKILQEESRFLGIIYRSIDPAKRSINQIVDETFKEIQNPTARKLIELVSIGSSVGMSTPLSVVKKSLGEQDGRLFSYAEVIGLIEDSCSVLVKLGSDIRGNYIAEVYHSLIAAHLTDLVSRARTDALYLSVARTIDLRSRIDAEFASALFIDHGVKARPGSHKPFSTDGLEASMTVLKDRQPARPILHHLARFKFDRDPDAKDIVGLLEQALVQPRETYDLDERPGNVLTTLARVKWRQRRDFLSQQGRNYPETVEIISLLEKVMEGPMAHLHPYHVKATILKGLARAKSGVEKLSIVNEGLEVIDEALTSGVDLPDEVEKLFELRADLLSEIDPTKAEAFAAQLVKEYENGIGYYSLARLEYHRNQNATKASAFLDRALEAKKCPPGALALKIEIVIEDKYLNHQRLFELVTRLEQVATFQDSWKSAYHKAIAYALNGRPKDARRYFAIANARAPRLERSVQLFWMEGGKRKTFRGKIGRILTRREGRVFSHDVPAWDDDIFFNPNVQQHSARLQTGSFVEFELGFSPRGPVCFDVRLSSEGRRSGGPASLPSASSRARPAR